MSCLTLGGGAHISHANLRVLHFKKENQGPSGLSATDLSESMPKMTSLVARLGHLEPSVLGLVTPALRAQRSMFKSQPEGLRARRYRRLSGPRNAASGGGNWVGSWVG